MIWKQNDAYVHMTMSKKCSLFMITCIVVSLTSTHQINYHGLYNVFIARLMVMQKGFDGYMRGGNAS